MKLCDYGCGREAKFQFKNGKWCCSKNYQSCPVSRNKHSIQIKKVYKNLNSVYNLPSYRKIRRNIMIKAHKDPDSGLNSILCREKKIIKMKEIWADPDSIYNSISWKKKKSIIMKKVRKAPNSIFNSISFRKKLSKSLKFTIEKINKKYPFFSKIEEMRYNPDKPDEKEVQVHCKNHNCKNSKEKDGWFTPTRSQIAERIRQLEDKNGNGGSYFYCCQECKDGCFLYNLQNDPYEIKNTNKPYTPGEQQAFNKHILKRDNEICYYCEEHADTVHHLRPQKLEPFFALDPDYAISVCRKCHYKHGHPTGSKHSTGNLAKVVCSVESQKFLEQNYK